MASHLDAPLPTGRAVEAQEPRAARAVVAVPHKKGVVSLARFKPWRRYGTSSGQ